MSGVNREEPGEKTKTGMVHETFGHGREAQSEAGKKGGERAKELGAGVMANPSGFGKKGGETAKERGAGIMADPSGYGQQGGSAKKGETE